jgi:nucleoside-diphosphate-sugar epimerase
MTRRIAVTGGSGKLGRAVVRELQEHGDTVFVLDRVPSPDPGVASVQIDLTDAGQTFEALTGIEDRYDGIDAVVHLAAVPRPGLIANSATFDGNITSTHHVFSAARAAGIRRIVWASSETVLGLPFSREDPPAHLPVDEEVPLRPNSSYSLAKTLEEEMARQFCRRDPGLTMIGLRFSNVMEPQDYQAFAGYQDDVTARIWNAWGYIDARDGAQAVRLALEADLTGTEVFIVANADTVMLRPSAELAAEGFPGVPLTRPVSGNETLLSIDKARRLLGFEPRHSWRDEVTTAV